VEPRLIPVDRIRILEGHNARRDVGDVGELADSIRALGVLQALTVVELGAEDGQPVYGLIAGERRLTAARQAGLAEVPCVVHDLDERQRIAAMLVENLQRQDLGVLEEARGIRRLADLDMSQREIARQLGRNQSHVSKRLALLALPEAIQAAIDQPRDGVARDARGITVAEALELTRLAEHPERQAEAFQHGRGGYYGGVAGLVRDQLAQVEREQARAAARSQLMSAGVKVIKERDYYGWTDMRERPLAGQKGHDHAAIRMAVKEHKGQPCHGAAIDRLGEVIYVCRDPSRHPDADPRTAAQVVEARQRQEEQRVDNRLRREAAHGRRAAIERVLASANTSNLPFAARQVTAHWRHEETKVACGLLGLEPVEERGPYGTHRDYRAALSGYAVGSMAAAIRALLALALASGEASVGSNWGGTSELGKRHMEVLAAAGYEPNDSDRKHLTGEPDRRAAGDEGDDERVCRGCGCSELEPCHGGCHWVEDPDRVGDLCSRCLEDIEEEAAAEMAGS
jgi:ParB/RepB/Spo0J family partition protein